MEVPGTMSTQNSTTVTNPREERGMRIASRYKQEQLEAYCALHAQEITPLHKNHPPGGGSCAKPPAFLPRESRVRVRGSRYPTRISTECQPDAPSGSGSESRNVWTSPLPSVARTFSG